MSPTGSYSSPYLTEHIKINKNNCRSEFKEKNVKKIGIRVKDSTCVLNAVQICRVQKINSFPYAKLE